MQTNQVSAAPSLGVEGNLFGNSGVDVSLYVQLLLVKDYDDQLKDSAKQIKISTKLKEAYRRQKQTISELYGKDKDKDGKVELTRAELALLESEPTFAWNKDAYGGQGGAETRYKNTPVDWQHGSYEKTDYNLGAGETAVAVNENAYTTGDPHFGDPDLKGGSWDFQGVPGHFYNYLTDTNLQVTAQHTAWSNGTTVIGQMQTVVHTEKESFNVISNAHGNVTVNGQDLAPGTSLTLGEEANVTFANKTLTVNTPEYTITQTLNGSYIDAYYDSHSQGVAAEGQNPDGAIGHTFDANAESGQLSAEEMQRRYQVAGFVTVDNSTVKVDKGKIEAEMERLQMEVDNLNGNSELISLTLQTLTNQRKTAFETVSNIFSKSAEAANNIARNIGR